MNEDKLRALVPEMEPTLNPAQLLSRGGRQTPTLCGSVSLVLPRVMLPACLILPIPLGARRL